MLARARTHLHNRLVRNTYLLVIIRIGGNGFGFLFWALAARLITAEAVGLASGIVSAASLLAGLAQFGLGYSVVRHLAHVDRPDDLISISLIITGLAGLLLSFLFLAMLPVVSPALLPLRTGPGNVFLFVIFVLSTTLTQLLNWIFLATHSLELRLFKQVGQTFLAIILLVLFQLWIQGYVAVVLAYAVATVSALGVSLFFLLPRAHTGYTFRPSRTWSVRLPFARFSLVNYAADQFERAPDTLMPLIVLHVLGPGPGAYFYIGWSLARGVAAWAGSVAESLFAEGSRLPNEIVEITGRAFRFGLALAGSLAVVMIIGGRFVLYVYGADYFANGSVLLTFVALAAIPTVLISIFVNYLRVENRLLGLFLILTASISISIGFSYIGMDYFGLAGVGVGWLTGQLAILGLVLFLRGARRLTYGRSWLPNVVRSSLRSDI